MTKLYQTTQKIHTELKRVEKETGIKIEVESDYEWIIDPEGVYNSGYNESQHPGSIMAIEPPQIRQILIDLQEVLGGNPKFNKYTGESDRFFHYVNNEILCEVHHTDNGVDELNFAYLSRELCYRWLDGLNPLFDQEPETVLKELLEILKTI